MTYKGQNVVTFTDYASFENVAQKGVIEVRKSGEVLSSVEKNEDKNGKIYTPVYAVKGLKNAVYDILLTKIFILLTVQNVLLRAKLSIL